MFTNTAPVDAYRGAGRPEATYVVERIVEQAARDMKMDPAEIRRQNFITEFPYATPVGLTYDIGNYAAHLDKAMEMADVAGFPARKAASRGEGQAARPRLLLLHRGLRHRADRTSPARSARAPACSRPARCASTRPAR